MTNPSDESKLFLGSLGAKEGVVHTDELLAWVKTLNAEINVDIKKTTLKDTGWFYDDAYGMITNKTRTFFQLSGFRSGDTEQPIIIQDEIGYVGFLCKPISGVLHFLIQAKIEPGNVNKIQLSPTIQATRSNFLQAHGGARPAYLDWFLNADEHYIVVDQVQSEQSSRFLGKRNRNIIVMLCENTEIEERASHKWVTLGQIKNLMKVDNLVNMDTRTAISCIPLHKYDFGAFGNPFSRSAGAAQPGLLTKIYRYINNYKMFDTTKRGLIPLYSLKDWQMVQKNGIDEFCRSREFHFRVVFCDISIEGREVRHWGQPLLEAQGIAVFGLFIRQNSGVAEFLVRARPEIGCFDKIELAPTIQLEATESSENDVDRLFLECYNEKRGVRHDVVLSEEGGRFYHEQNRNIIGEARGKFEQTEYLPLLTGFALS